MDAHSLAARFVNPQLKQAAAPRKFVDPNDVRIQYRWDCVENCVQPEYQWFDQVKEK